MTAPPDAIQEKWTSKLPTAAAAIVIFIYLFSAVHNAARLPLWMDEVLTLWTVQQPGMVAIYHTLARGAQTIPPGHPVLLYWWAKIAGFSLLSLRLPSILAGLATGLAMFTILRRYVASGIAVFGLSLSLCGELYRFDLQLRPYALTVACYAICLLLWHGLLKSESLWRLGGIVLLFSFAISFHFYSVLYLVSFGLIELLFELATQRFRIRVWISICLSGLSIVFWLPLAHAFQQLLQKEGGPQYYAKPTYQRLTYIIDSLYFPAEMRKPLLLWISLVVLLLLFRGPVATTAAKTRKLVAAQPLFAMALGSTVLPVITFLFARFSGTYNDRYVLPGDLGVIMLICIAAEHIPYEAVIAPAMSVLLATSSLHMADLQAAVNVDFPAILSDADLPLPIVLPEGLLFFEVQETPKLTRNQKHRFVYLTLPTLYALKDSTNEHLLENWKVIKPELRVYSAATFLTSTPCVYLLDTFKSADDLADFLQQQGHTSKTLTKREAGYLSLVCSSVAANAAVSH